MPDSNTMVIRAPPGSHSSIRRFIHSFKFPFRRRSSPGDDDDLEQAEFYLEVTDEQLDIIYKASRQASETYAEEIMQIEDQFEEIIVVFNTLKRARGGHESALNKTLRRIDNDTTTKVLLDVAQKLSRKAKHTSKRVTSVDPLNFTMQTTSTPECQIVPNNELTRQTNVREIHLSFQRRSTANNAKTMKVIVDVPTELDPDATIRGVRPRRSDLPGCFYHSPNAYNTGEFRVQSGVTSSRLLCQSRTSTGMHLGDNTTFRHCNLNVVVVQSNDSSTVSDATSNLGVDAIRRGLLGAPPLPSAGRGSPCPSCGASRDVEAIQGNDISLQDAAVENTQSVPEQYIPDPPVNMQPDSQASRLTTAGTQNAKSHSLTASGSAMVFSPTMNVKSPGATGATNTYFSSQPAHSPPPQASAQNPHLEGSGLNCMDFTGNSVVYSPTFNDESPDASGAYNQEIPTAGSRDPLH